MSVHQPTPFPTARLASDVVVVTHVPRYHWGRHIYHCGPRFTTAVSDWFCLDLEVPAGPYQDHLWTWAPLWPQYFLF